MASTSREVGGWLAAAVVGRRISRRCIHGGCCRRCAAACGRAAPNGSAHNGTATSLRGRCCWAWRRPRMPSAWFRRAGGGGVSGAAKTRGDGPLATRQARRTSHLIVKLDERELVRRSRSAARQGCTLGRGGAWHFDWAATGQDDNKRASGKLRRYSHGPAAAWGPFTKPWASLQPVVASDAYTARGRAPSAPRASYQLPHT